MVPNIGGSKEVWFPPVIQYKFGNIAFDAEYPSFPSPPAPCPIASEQPLSFSMLRNHRNSKSHSGVKRKLLWSPKHDRGRADPLLFLSESAASRALAFEGCWTFFSPTGPREGKILGYACQPLGSSCDTLFASFLRCISSAASAQVCLRATRAAGQNVSLARRSS